MLEPVALSHPRFRIPGLTQDGRGVVVGTQAVALVYSLDRLVSLLRLLSSEPSLGDLLPTLAIEEVRNALGARGYLLRFVCADSRILDRCAGAAALCLGAFLVGSERHFIAYRDRRAPLGYDASELHNEGGDYILYGATGAQAYARLAELSLLRLLFRLELLPQPGGKAAALHDALLHAEELWLLLPLGLLLRALRFFWHRGVEVSAALPDPLPSPDERPQSQPQKLFSQPALLRLLPREGDPAAASCLAGARLLLELPEVRALKPLTADHLAVELGHAHPLRLLAFERLFDAQKRHLFLAGTRSVLTLPVTPFVSAERLIELRYQTSQSPRAEAPAPPLRPKPAHPAFTDGEAPLRLELKLVSEKTPGEAPTATLLPWSQAKTLGRMLTLLPASLFSELFAVCLDEGVLILGEGGAISSLPLGRQFYAAAPSVFVPLGMVLSPRLRGELLRAKLGTQEGYVVFLPGVPPFSLPRNLFSPVSGAFVARLLLDERTGPHEVPPPPTTIVNDSLGVLWPLWGK